MAALVLDSGALIALVAATTAGVVCTSDPDDMRTLLRACGRAAQAIIRC